MGARIVIKHSYIAGQGLGKEGREGKLEPILLNHHYVWNDVHPDANHRCPRWLKFVSTSGRQFPYPGDFAFNHRQGGHNRVSRALQHQVPRDFAFNYRQGGY